MRKTIYKSYAGRRQAAPVGLQHVVAEKVPGELQPGHEGRRISGRVARLVPQKVR